MDQPISLPENSVADGVDLRVAAAATEYQNRRENGETPDRKAFLSQRSDIADQLSPCLDAIDFVFGVVPPLASNPESRTPTQLGEFRILRKLGSGGMGIVFEAEQLSLHRRVALKVLPSVASFDERALQRFQHESQAAASLNHPHIVPIYAVGQDQGVHYFAMQLIEGHSLAQVLQSLRASSSKVHSGISSTISIDGDVTRLRSNAESKAVSGTTLGSSPRLVELSAAHYYREIARLMREAANALQHAHEVGVIHRDVKPGNLLLDHQGKLWITDFGLAKLPGSDLTGSADVMGTLRYMAPEQASGKTVSLDARSDVYSLGTTLYELVTLCRPFDADNQEALLRKVLTEEPLSPKKIARQIPRDLETIVMKSMAKSASDRYSSAKELAADLDRFLADEPIVARAPSVAQRATKWMKRNRVLTASIVISIPLLLMAGILGLSIGAYRLDEQRRTAESALERESIALGESNAAKARATERLAAEKKARASERLMAYYHAVSLANVEAESGNIEAARGLLESCPAELRGFEWGYVNQLCHAELSTIHVESEFVNDISFLPTGELATIEPHGIQLWNSPEGLLSQQWPRFVAEAAVDSVKLSPNGKYAIRFLRHKFKFTKVNPAMLPIQVIEAASGKVLGIFPGHTDGVVDLVVSPDSRTVISSDRTGRLAIWDIGLQRPTVALADAKALAIAFSPKGDRFAAATKGAIEIRDSATGTIIKSIRDSGRSGPIAIKLQFSTDGRILATNNDLVGKVRIVDIDSGETLKVLDAEMGEGGIFALSPDGMSLATTDHRDYSIRVWDWRKGALEDRFFVGREQVRSIHYSPGGDYIVALSGKCLLQCWDLTQNARFEEVGLVTRFATITSNSNLPYSRIVVSPNGKHVALFAGTRTSIFDFHKRELQHVHDAKSHIFDMQFGVNRNNLLQFTGAGTARLDLTNGQSTRLVSLVTLSTMTSYGKFSGDTEVRFGNITYCPQTARFAGDRLLRASTARSKEKFWIDHIDMENGQSKLTYKGSIRGFVYCVAGSKDGTRVAAAGMSENALLAWNGNVSQESWKQPSTLRVLAMEYSNDGKRLGVADADGTLRVLDAETGAQISRISLPVQERVQFAFDSSGERVAIAIGRLFEESGEVRICEVSKGQTLVRIPFERAIESVQFSLDDRYLFASDFSGKLWMIQRSPKSSDERLAAHQRFSSKWRQRRIQLAQAAKNSFAELWNIDQLLLVEPGLAKFKADRASLKAAQGEMEVLNNETADALETQLNLREMPAAFLLSAHYYQRGDAASHQRMFQSLVAKLKPDSDKHLFSQVYRLGVMGPGGVKDLDAFVAECERKFSGQDPNSQMSLHFLRGMARYRAGKFEAALDDLQKTSKEAVESPSYPIIYLYLSMTQARLELRDESQQSLARAEDLFQKAFASREKWRNAHLIEFHYPLLKHEANVLLEAK